MKVNKQTNKLINDKDLTDLGNVALLAGCEATSDLDHLRDKTMISSQTHTRTHTELVCVCVDVCESS